MNENESKSKEELELEEQQKRWEKENEELYGGNDEVRYNPETLAPIGADPKEMTHYNPLTLQEEPKLQGPIQQYEEQKVELLTKYGVPKDELWLTEVEETQTGKGVVYYHESGNVSGARTFTDQESFDKACRNMCVDLYGEAHVKTAEKQYKLDQVLAESKSSQNEKNPDKDLDLSNDSGDDLTL